MNTFLVNVSHHSRSISVVDRSWGIISIAGKTYPIKWCVKNDDVILKRFVGLINILHFFGELEPRGFDGVT